MYFISKAKSLNPRNGMNKRNEMRKINEALQYLTKKRHKSKALEDWQVKGKKAKTFIMAFNALQVSPFFRSNF